MVEGKSGGRISSFDRLFYVFECRGPECGYQFHKILRNLLDADEVLCPQCGGTIDIRESKRTGEIGKMFDTARQRDTK